MSETVVILIQQVVIMFLLMGVGYILYKTGKIDSIGTSQFSYFVLYVSTPFITIQSMLVAYSNERLVLGVKTLCLAFVCTVIAALVCFIIYKKNRRLDQFGIIFSNTGFLGIPLVNNVLGSEWVFYISIFNIVTIIIMYTYGIYLISGDAKNMSLKKIVTNPPIIAMFVGIILFLTQIQLPNILLTTINYLATTTTAIAMMIIGVYLAQANLKAIIKEKYVWLVCLMRLVVMPIITLIILSLFDMDINVKIVVLIAMSAPCPGALAMFCQQYGQSYEYGASVVGLSTLLSLITMPIFVHILTAL